jgi:hypothetical protein
MSWRVIGLLGFAVTSAVVGIASTAVTQAMVDAVNKTRPPESRISPSGWYPGKLGSVVALYRQAAPNGRRHIQLAALAAVGAVGLVLAAACILVPE